MPVLVIYNILYYIIEVLKSSFKEALSADKLRSNFSTL